MYLNVAINGFGRIGKVALSIIEKHRLNGVNIRVVAINDIGNIDQNLHLL